MFLRKLIRAIRFSVKYDLSFLDRNFDLELLLHFKLLLEVELLLIWSRITICCRNTVRERISNRYRITIRGSIINRSRITIRSLIIIKSWSTIRSQITIFLINNYELLLKSNNLFDLEYDLNFDLNPLRIFIQIT